MNWAAEQTAQVDEATLHHRRMSAVASLVLVLVLLIAATGGYLLVRSEVVDAAQVRLSATSGVAMVAVSGLFHETEADSLRHVMRQLPARGASLVSDSWTQQFPVDPDGVAWSEDVKAGVPVPDDATATERSDLLERCRADGQPLDGDSVCVLPGEPLLLGNLLRIGGSSITLVTRIEPARLQSALSGVRDSTMSADVILVGGAASEPVLLATSAGSMTDIHKDLPGAAARVVRGQAGSAIETAEDKRRYMSFWRPHNSFAIGVVAAEEMEAILQPTERFLYIFVALSLGASLLMYFALLLLGKARR